MKRTLEMGEGKTNFTFAYTDPKKDVDVSAHMEEKQIIEKGMSKVGLHKWY